MFARNMAVAIDVILLLFLRKHCFEVNIWKGDVILQIGNADNKNKYLLKDKREFRVVLQT